MTRHEAFDALTFASDTIVVVGPGVISTGWVDTDYPQIMEYISDMQDALGLPVNKTGNWSINWV